MKNWIKEIKDSGKLIILSDNSKWFISSFDAFDTKFWMKLDNVSVKGSKMVSHSQRDKTVDVRQIR